MAAGDYNRESIPREASWGKSSATDLGGCFDVGPTFQQLRDDVDVAFLGCQVQGIQAIL